MEILQLEAFVSLANTEHMPQTAQELNTTQSHISKLIASLEAELGEKLFDRAGRGIRLNEKGRLYYEYAAGALQMMQNGDTALKNSRGSLSGTVRIGEYAFSHILHECIAAFAKRYPRIDFFFSEMHQPDARMLMATTDIVLHSSQQENSVLGSQFPVCRELFEDDMSYVFISPRFRRFPKEQKTIQVEELKEFPLIETMPSPFYRDPAFPNQSFNQVRELFGVSLRIGFTVKDFFSKLSLLDEGVGIALFPEVCREPVLRFAPDLQVFRLEGKRIERSIMISRKKKEQLSPAAIAFWDFMTCYFGLDHDREQ